MDGPSLAVGIKRARPDLNTQNRSWGLLEVQPRVDTRNRTRRQGP